ncbi:MAG: V-type ATP synthase subunit D [archaeon]
MGISIKATRMELLRQKKKIKLAQKGHKLLKEKRDALISEFFGLVDRLKGARLSLEDELKVAFQSLILAQAVSGRSEVELAAGSVSSQVGLKTTIRAIMGVKVPQFSFDATEQDVFSRGYSVVSTSIELDKASEKFEKALVSAIQLAELEATLTNLGEEIKKTKRKVNALEQIVIPRLSNLVTQIKMRLEEMERENFGRLKIIKANQE